MSTTSARRARLSPDDLGRQLASPAQGGHVGGFAVVAMFDPGCDRGIRRRQRHPPAGRGRIRATPRCGQSGRPAAPSPTMEMNPRCRAVFRDRHPPGAPPAPVGGGHGPGGRHHQFGVVRGASPHRQIGDRRDAHRAEVVRGSDTGQHQQVGGLDGARRQHDPIGAELDGARRPDRRDADRPGAGQPDPHGSGRGVHGEVGPVHHRLEEGRAGTASNTVDDVRRNGTHPGGCSPHRLGVEVRQPPEAGRPCGLDEYRCATDELGGPPDSDRPAVTAVGEVEVGLDGTVVPDDVGP